VTLQCQVTTNEALQNDVRRLVLSLPAAASYHAGQYLSLSVGERAFPFSIANAPGGQHLELHIKATEDSADSALIEQFLNDHPSSVTIEYPLGQCFLSHVPAQPVIFIAAATGITQIKSMFDWLTAQPDAQTVHVYWGVVTPDDLYLDDYFTTAAAHANITYTPVVSHDDKTWAGRVGLVGDAVHEDFKNLNDHLIFVSGSPGMVYGTLDRLTAKGFDPKNMRSDVFDYAPRSA
jgi:CDP-4-dehydro-6-deoxyglucose reductase